MKKLYNIYNYDIIICDHFVPRNIKMPSLLKTIMLLYFSSPFNYRYPDSFITIM